MKYKILSTTIALYFMPISHPLYLIFHNSYFILIIMIPISFDYKRATSLDEALALLAEGDAKILSGGHSLIPAMKLRLNAPSTLIDVARIPALKGISVEGNTLVIGAATTHAEIANSAVVKDSLAMLAAGAAHIGDPAVRHRGTIGGSLAHADPAADWGAMLLAADATVVCQSANGERSVAITDFFTGLFSTSLEDDEIIKAVRVPIPAAGVKSAYIKFVQPASRFAIVGCAVVRQADGSTAVALTGVSENPFRDRGVEAAISGKELNEDNIAAAANAVEDVEVLSDHYASASYRLHIAKLYVKKALSSL
jgi:aerobic carbon-monoxide dehydrogenase medium subunit